MAGIVLSDASSLIGLARVDGLPWLGALFGVVWIPIEVRNEVLKVLAGSGALDEVPIQAAKAAGILRVWPAPAPLQPELPEGEAACIRIGLTDQANQTAALLLMDERAGRSVTQEHGLRVAGTAAVIGMAKSRGLIPSAKTVFARLHGSDFRISAAVIATILRRVGE